MISPRLMRDFDFAVSTNGVSYTTISGVNNASINREYGDADATVFDDNGWRKVLNVSAGVTIVVEGLQLFDPSDDSRDAGQALVEASTGQFGNVGLRYYRVTHSGSASSLSFQANAKRLEMGGGNDDLVPWGVELAVWGKPTASGLLWADQFPA